MRARLGRVSEASGRKAAKFFMGATARLKEVLFASGRKAGKFFMGATARLKEVIRKWIDKGRVSFALFRSELLVFMSV